MRTYELPIRAADLANLKISRMRFVVSYLEDQVGPAGEARLTGKLSELGWTLSSCALSALPAKFRSQLAVLPVCPIDIRRRVGTGYVSHHSDARTSTASGWVF